MCENIGYTTANTICLDKEIPHLNTYDLESTIKTIIGLNNNVKSIIISPEIEELSLNSSNFNEISNTTFNIKEQNNLTKLTITGSNISKLNSDAKVLQKLTKLNLSRNKLNKVSLKSDILEYLDLSRNIITGLDIEIECPNLKEIKLEQNIITTDGLNYILKQLPKTIKKINISSNKLKGVIDLRKFNCLQELICTSNKINHLLLPNSIYNLYCSGNLIPELVLSGVSKQNVYCCSCMTMEIILNTEVKNLVYHDNINIKIIKNYNNNSQISINPTTFMVSI